MIWCMCDDESNIMEEKHILQNNVLNHVKKSLNNKILTTKRKKRKIKREILKVNLKICKLVVYNRFKRNSNREHILREFKHKKLQLKKELQIICDNLKYYQSKQKNSIFN